MNSNTKIGRLFKIDSGFFYVRLNDELVTCRASGLLRKKKNELVVGDLVSVASTSPGDGYIVGVFARRNLILRPRLSNIDQMLVLVSSAIPQTNPLTLDKFLAVLIHKEILPIIVATKQDLSDTSKFTETYRAAGYKVLNFGGITRDGLVEVKEVLAGKLTAVSGDSGVGKTTLINALMPEKNLPTGGVSQKLGRGRHVTRHCEIFEFAPQSFIIDTPGFSKVDSLIEEIKPDELAGCFLEFRPYMGGCKFAGCTHMVEEDCMVLKAVELGQISASRHKRFMAIRGYLTNF